MHDPTILKRPTGGYLVAHTGDGISLKTSADRITFRNAGAAFPGGTPWANTYTNNSRHLWAPDISYRNGHYWTYCSASTFGSNRSAIFLATSPSGNPGTWTHRGLVVESRTSDNFNAIDPNLVVDDQGRWWLNFGSFWSGIKLIQLDPATGLRLGSSMTGIAYNGAIEAPFIVKRGNYYYQYVSFDLCCRGAQSTYRVMVDRSTCVTGPYVDRNGRAMTSKRRHRNPGRARQHPRPGPPGRARRHRRRLPGLPLLRRQRRRTARHQPPGLRRRRPALRRLTTRSAATPVTRGPLRSFLSGSRVHSTHGT